MVIKGEDMLLYSLVMCQILKFYGTLKILFLHRTIWGWEFQNAAAPTVFIRLRSNFITYRLLLFCN